MLLAFVVLLALASACSNKQELVPAPDAPVISFVADLELRYFPPTTAQPNDTTRVKKTYRSDDAWRLDAFQSDSPAPAQAAAVQGAGGGGAGLQASTIQYNPIISDEDLALDLDRLHRIEAPELFFTPVP